MKVPVTALLAIFALTFLLPMSVLFGQRNTPVGNSWAETKASKKGTIIAYWHESRPFIFKQAGKMAGIEFELMENFQQFLKDEYNVSLEVTWKEAPSFAETYASIRDKQDKGIFGVSAFSITPERKEHVRFSAPYMSDICVLITSNNVPVVQSEAEFREVFSKLTAVTIKQTTYEQDLLRLREEGNLDFKLQYIPSRQNILRTIEQMDDAFGFIDLPVYMMIFSDDPSVKVKRQNIYPKKREGYALIHPINSDWSEPLSAFFASDNFHQNLEKIIGRHIDIELYHFIESLASESDPIVLLTKEKEIQTRDLMGKMKQIEEEEQARRILIALVIISFSFLVIIIVLYRKRSQQKQKIEAQRENIELKNQQLEKRNEHLVALDEEKNNLIKILAHDLRTPINHVQGLAQVFMLTNPDLPDSQRVIIQEITDASLRLNKMITNILDIDAIENGRARIFIDDLMFPPIVQQVVKSFEKQAARKGIQLDFKCQDEKVMMKGDPLFLMQIIENLVSNAIKFSPGGSIVAIQLSNVDQQVHLSVKDSGPGLTAEDHQLLFQKFQRLSARPTAGESSTGLGLSIVKKYVESMGGKVRCESEAGKGATFIVTFSSHTA
jgi:signal transduction histidine kinase/ABC-type amino acid transport substrate-binding protein